MSITYDRIKQLSIENNTTIAKLQKDLNFGNSVIAGWKHSVPQSDKLCAVADYFNVSVDYLLGRTDDRNPCVPSSHLSEKALDIIHFVEVKKPNNRRAEKLLNIMNDIYSFSESEDSEYDD